MLELIKDMKSFEERFWDKIKVKGKDDCWEWTGCVGKAGYGMITVGSTVDGSKRRLSSHRLSYALHFGEFDDNLCVLHKCDNRVCVNPRHLFLGNYTDNLNDSIKKGRATQHSEEANRKRSETLTGKKWSEERKNNFIPHKQSEDTRRKIAEGVKRKIAEKKLLE